MLSAPINTLPYPAPMGAITWNIRGAVCSLFVYFFEHSSFPFVYILKYRGLKLGSHDRKDSPRTLTEPITSRDQISITAVIQSPCEATNISTRISSLSTLTIFSYFCRSSYIYFLSSRCRLLDRSAQLDKSQIGHTILVSTKKGTNTIETYR